MNDPFPQSFDEDLEAIQEALDAIEQGDRGISLEEFDREFRALHGLPPPRRSVSVRAKR